MGGLRAARRLPAAGAGRTERTRRACPPACRGAERRRAGCERAPLRPARLPRPARCASLASCRAAFIPGGGGRGDASGRGAHWLRTIDPAPRAPLRMLIGGDRGGGVLFAPLGGV
ncbi:uncharacterized protein LOC141580523 [Saimiri boliviensis]|uniref:uncharacterized protein LOC141580523 n=1 Tax=Saimiri boliviensis TaxID=27679 RepID=UPI003D7784E0